MVKKNKLVYGVGINDADYNVYICEIVDGKQKNVWTCPYYIKWYSMLGRCYSKGYQDKQPTYKGCSICEEWRYFSNFRKWMIKQEWEGRQLDKDFLFESNKVYSPTTCTFVPQKVNNFVTTREKLRGAYPLGVCLDKKAKKNPYSSRCKGGDNESGYLGVFPAPEDAHQAWLRKKLEVCEEYLIEFKDEPLIVQGLTRIRDKIQHHIDTKTELKSF